MWYNCDLSHIKSRLIKILGNLHCPSVIQMAHGAGRVAELGLKIKEIKLILMHYFCLGFQQNYKMFKIHIDREITSFSHFWPSTC